MKKHLGFLCRRGLTMLAIALMSAFLWINPAFATSFLDVPDVPSDTHVVDLAEIVSRSNEGKINELLSALADETGQDVHYVTIRRLDYDETIESFTEKLFDRWFSTPAAAANQTLIVIDNLTNNSAIRTGEKTKSILSDAIATSVAQETIQVPLRQGNRYNQAFLDATDRLVAVLSGGSDPGPPIVQDTVKTEGTFASREQTEKSNAIPWVIGLLLAATVIPMATYYWYVR